MPMAVGRSWTYEVTSGFSSRVAEVRVVRRIAVDGCNGYELAGPAGVSRLAWRGDRLIAGRLGDSLFSPALPLLTARTGAPRQIWHGRMDFLGVQHAASATIDQQSEPLTEGGRTFPTLHSTVTVRLGGRKIEVQCWFASGTGLVREVQRTGESEDVELDWLRGP